MGQKSHRHVNSSRAEIAALLGIEETTSLLFNSGGTEGINHVFHSIRRSRKAGTYDIITSSVEHRVIIKLVEDTAPTVTRVVEIPVNRRCQLELSDLDRALSKATHPIVSLSLVNSETGCLTPAEEVHRLCKKYRALLHFDAVQALGKTEVKISKIGCDYLTFSAHKFHGPEGVGGLYVRPGAPLYPLIRGGNEESNGRGGTENVSGILCMAAAAKEAINNLNKHTRHMSELRNQLEDGILMNCPGSQINGDIKNRICNTSNIYFPGKDSARLVERLSNEGVYVSAGSACTRGGKPSHVLLAMGLGEERANASLRFSLSRLNTSKEIEEAIRIICRVVNSSKLRGKKPLRGGAS